MTDSEIRAIVLREIGKIAPEAEFDQLAPTANLREELDIDSMDALNIMVGIHEATGVDIPEADYPQMTTLDRCVAYLRVRIKKV